jgi:hypothetical protein
MRKSYCSRYRQGERNKRKGESLKRKKRENEKKLL